MAYKLKKEYAGLIMNFPELGMRNLSTDEMNDASIQAKLMRSGHAGYFEPEEPIDLNIEIVIDYDLKKKQEAEKAQKLKEEAELKAKAEAEIQSQLTASTSKEAKTDWKKSAKPVKKKK
jgi:hypothetical protein